MLTPIKAHHTYRPIRFFLALFTSVLISLFCLSNISFAHAKTEKAEHKKNEEVVILTASWCNYCNKTRQFLKSNHIKFTEYDIENSNVGYQLYRSLNAKGIPVIRVGQAVLFGYDPQKLKEMLNESGYDLP